MNKRYRDTHAYTLYIIHISNLPCKASLVSSILRGCAVPWCIEVWRVRQSPDKIRSRKHGSFLLTIHDRKRCTQSSKNMKIFFSVFDENNKNYEFWILFWVWYKIQNSEFRIFEKFWILNFVLCLVQNSKFRIHNWKKNYEFWILNFESDLVWQRYKIRRTKLFFKI